MNILVVDDQRLSRKGIIKMINWEGMQLRLCGEASNGKEALEFMAHQHVDILITDVRMPLLDGLQLTEQAQNLNDNLSVIITSGYDDFNYVRKALQLSVVDYLLKPVSSDDLNQTLLKIQNGKAEELSKHKKYIQVLREQFYYSYMEDIYIDETELKADFLLLESGSPDDFFCSMLIKDKQTFSLDKESEEAFKYRLKEVMEHHLSCHLTLYRTTEGLVAIWNSPALSMQSIKDNLQRMSVTATQQKSYYMGSIVQGLSSLKLSIHQAYENYAHHSAGNNKPLETYGAKFNIYEPADSIVPEFVMADPRLGQEWSHYLKLGNREAAKQSLSQLLMHYRKHASSVQNKMYTYLVINGLSDLLEAGYLNPAQFTEGCMLSKAVAEPSPIDELEDRIADFFDTCLAVISQMDEQESKRKVVQTMAYIDQHFSEELALSDFAEQYYISPGYFSHLFKQVAGVNFLQYITKLRMDKAKHLIKADANAKIYEVAHRCGYQDVKYFRKLFKRHTGLTPQLYKEQHHVS